MPQITIKDMVYNYSPDDVLTFSEGLIGFPEIRDMVLVGMDGLEPFCWLASPANEAERFVVVEPELFFESYEPFAATNEERMRTLAIVKVSQDWQNTTVNLRAPLRIDATTRRAEQVILSDASYKFSQLLAQKLN